MKNALLIFPPTDSNCPKDEMNRGPVLGLVALKNYVTRVQGIDTKIDIIDGDYHSLEEIKKMIATNEYDIVGLQPMMSKYKNTLNIAAFAKTKGKQVILGGHHATQLAENIMKNRNEIIDCVIVRDGEEAFLKLIQGESFENIPNLVYWQDGQVKKTEVQNMRRLYALTYLDPNDIAQYEKSNEKETDPYATFRAYALKGCAFSCKKGRCSFCGRMDKGVRFKKPEDYVAELRYMAENTKANYIWEIGDDFLPNMKWVEKVIELLEKEPLKNNVEIRIFARADRINPKTVEYLKKLNVKQVVIGFESANDEILKQIPKSITAKDNMQAAELLLKNGIEPVVNYVLGLPGETEQTLKKTLQQAREIQKLTTKYLGRPPTAVVGNILEIVPGSDIYKKLLETYPKYKDKDDLDLYETLLDFLKTFPSIKDDLQARRFIKRLNFYSKEMGKLGEFREYAEGVTLDKGEENATKSLGKRNTIRSL